MVAPLSSTRSTDSGYGSGNSAADLSDSFMKLLVAQMQNQDPTNPMDNNQLTAQLAQFNTAAGVEKLNTSMTGVQAMMAQLGSMSAASWVGRHVLIEGDPEITPTPSPRGDSAGSESFSFLLGGEAETVTVTLTDSEGNAYTAELKNVNTGVQTFSFEDLTNFKPAPPAPDTTYSLSFEASNTGGDKPEISGLIQRQVEGVTMTANGAVLHLQDHDPVGMADVVVIQK